MMLIVYIMNIMEKVFVIKFKQGSYIDGANCKIVPSEDYKVVLGKQWIDERNATFDEEA